MKKVLFATTALIATASVAAADVRISGYGRFGLDYNDNNSNKAGDPANNGTPETTLTSRLRLQFDMSTETDGGVGFNARLRMQAESRDNRNLSNGNASLLTDAAGVPVLDVNGEAIKPRNDDNGFNGARFGVSYGGLLVNVGNIIGAVENTPGLYTTGTRSAGTGVDGMGFNSLVLKDGGWDAYSSDGQGVNGVEALYTMGGFTGHISYSDRNDTDIDSVTFIGLEGESRVGIMLTYAWNDYYVAASYQDSSNGVTLEGTETNDLWMISGGGSWNQFGARLAYGQTGLTKSFTLEGNMDIGSAQNIVLWYNRSDSNKTSDGSSGVAAGTKFGTEGNSWGINYQYDLGGGATFVAGYVDSQNSLLSGLVANNGKQRQFQAGVYFSF